MNYVSFFHVQSTGQTGESFFILFYFFLNTDHLVKGTPWQLNSISECVESCLYIHTETDISSDDDDVDDDGCLGSNENQKLSVSENLTLGVTILNR